MPVGSLTNVIGSGIFKSRNDDTLHPPVNCPEYIYTEVNWCRSSKLGNRRIHETRILLCTPLISGQLNRQVWLAGIIPGLELKDFHQIPLYEVRTAWNGYTPPDMIETLEVTTYPHIWMVSALVRQFHSTQPFLRPELLIGCLLFARVSLSLETPGQ